MQKFRLEYIAGAFISREFFASLADGTSIFDAINEGSTRYSFNLQKRIGQVRTQSNAVLSHANTAYYENASNEIVELRGYANMWGWGFKAKAGSSKEANFVVLDRFVKKLGNGFSQVKKATNQGVNEYFFQHEISDLMSLRVRSTAQADLADLTNLATIIARTGECEIYHSQVLPFSVVIQNLTRPVELKFMKLQGNQLAGKGDVLCQAGGNRDRVADRLRQLGYDIVAEKEY